MVTNGLRILNVPMVFQDFVTNILVEALFQDVVHINDFLLLGNAHVMLGILSSCVTCQPSYVTYKFFYFIFFHVSFGEFRQENYVGMWGYYGFRVMGGARR